MRLLATSIKCQITFKFNSTEQYILRYLTSRLTQLYEGHCWAYVVITSRAKTRRDFYNETIYKSNVVSTVCFQFAVSIDISDWNRDLVDVHHLNNFKIIKKLIHSTFWKWKKLANAKDFGFEFGHRVLVSLLSIAQFPEVSAFWLFALFCNIIII
jgi:hypothetical protein